MRLLLKIFLLLVVLSACVFVVLQIVSFITSKPSSKTITTTLYGIIPHAALSDENSNSGPYETLLLGKNLKNWAYYTIPETSKNAYVIDNLVANGEPLNILSASYTSTEIQTKICQLPNTLNISTSNVYYACAYADQTDYTRNHALGDDDKYFNAAINNLTKKQYLSTSSPTIDTSKHIVAYIAQLTESQNKADNQWALVVNNNEVFPFVDETTSGLPALSPDRTKIVFNSSRSIHDQKGTFLGWITTIYVYSLEENKIIFKNTVDGFISGTNFTNDESNTPSAIFNNSGTLISYQISGQTLAKNRYINNLLTSKQTIIPNACEAAFLTSDNLLYNICSRTNEKDDMLYQMDPNTEKVSKVLDTVGHITTGNNNSYALLAGKHCHWADTCYDVYVNGKKTGYYDRVDYITFSPDGKHFAYTAKKAKMFNSGHYIHFINIDGKDVNYGQNIVSNPVFTDDGMLYYAYTNSDGSITRAQLEL